MKTKFQTWLDESGRVAIPPEIISELHLTPGTILEIEAKDRKIALEPVIEEPILIEKEGVLVLHAQLTEDISNIVEKEREKRISTIFNASLK